MAKLEMPLKAASVAFDTTMAAVARALATIWSRQMILWALGRGIQLHKSQIRHQGLASHALSVYLRKAPAAGGSHGSGTGVELRRLDTSPFNLVSELRGYAVALHGRWVWMLMA
eukprot:scaffold20320_cov112-Skeletonema_dohrnii-CCMP3373.AAC.8